MAKIIGAKITYYKLASQGIPEADIEKRVIRDFPSLSTDSLKRYRNDCRRLYPAKNTPKDSIDSSSSITNTNSDLGISDTQNSNQKTDQKDSSQNNYDVKEFNVSVGDSTTPPEAIKMAEMYKNGMAPVEPVRLEFIPKIAKRGFDLFLKIPQIRKYLDKWEDKESMNMMFDEMEGMVKKRIHASSRNSDVLNVILAASVVGVSMGSHIVLNKKYDLTEERKIIAEKAPSAKEQLEQIEKQVDESHKAQLVIVQLDPEKHLDNGKEVKRIDSPVIIPSEVEDIEPITEPTHDVR